uniref:Large ribosomal subunit protein P1 n=1 Tax=uncultured korarchaeote TaxID=161241 RepID=A0A1L2JJW4_9CREN|nr:ribosomal protein L12E/L44/L45/RPP1/RPP2 [uncultured korarchaeote]
MSMEYLYAALLLYEAKKDINEENLKKVLEAAGITPEEAWVKRLVNDLREINIEEVLKAPIAAPIAAPSAAPAPTPTEEEKPKEERKKEEEEKKEEEALAGLSALFG